MILISYSYVLLIVKIVFVLFLALGVKLSCSKAKTVIAALYLLQVLFFGMIF